MSIPRDPMRDPIRDSMKDGEPAGPSGSTIAALVLVPLGLVLIFSGLCLGLWVMSIAYNMLYHPDQVPLVGKVLELIQKNDVVFQAVQENGTTRFEGAGVRYGILLLLLFVVLAAFGGVIKAFVTGGTALVNAGLGRKPDEPAKK